MPFEKFEDVDALSILHSMELFCLGRAAQRRGRAFAVGDNLGDEIEVTGADFALMFCRRIPLAFGGESRLLQYCIRRHAVIAIIARKIKHTGVQRVKSSERNELKFVTYRSEFALKFCDAGATEFLLPVERRRTIVSH